MMFKSLLLCSAVAVVCCTEVVYEPRPIPMEGTGSYEVVVPAGNTLLGSIVIANRAVQWCDSTAFMAVFIDGERLGSFEIDQPPASDAQATSFVGRNFTEGQTITLMLANEFCAVDVGVVLHFYPIELYRQFIFTSNNVVASGSDAITLDIEFPSTMPLFLETMSVKLAHTTCVAPLNASVEAYHDETEVHSYAVNQSSTENISVWFHRETAARDVSPYRVNAVVRLLDQAEGATCIAVFVASLVAYGVDLPSTDAPTTAAPRTDAPEWDFNSEYEFPWFTTLVVMGALAVVFVAVAYSKGWKRTEVAAGVPVGIVQGEARGYGTAGDSGHVEDGAQTAKGYTTVGCEL